jgi:hypothetical protein
MIAMKVLVMWYTWILLPLSVATFQFNCSLTALDQARNEMLSTSPSLRHRPPKEVLIV